MTTSATAARLWCETGGSGSPALVLLHGLGANAKVWERLRPIIESQWPGRWIAPDFRGHGRSFHQGPYAFGIHASDVANLLEQNEEVVCLAHSMGGAVAMALASGWFGVRVRQVVAFGVKLEWLPGETAKLRELGRAPVHWFETRAEAVQRFLRVSGLDGLVDPASECAAGGVVERGGKFRLAMDPCANLVAGPPIERLIQAMNAPLRLAAGEKDPMVTVAQMRRYDPDAVLLPGLGHNAHLESPERLWELMEPVAARYRAGDR